MGEDRERLSVLQSCTACDVVIQQYDYLVEHVNAIRIFPYLVSSGLVDQDFRQYLDGERTDKDKMMALLRELTRSPKETWFDRFTNALSKVPQYEEVAGNLLGDFTKLMEERLARPPPDQQRRVPRMRASTSEPLLVIKVASSDSGVNGIMTKAMCDAQAGYKAALLELQKANAYALEAEKDKVYAEAEKSVLEERAKLIAVCENLAEVEMHKQLLVKESQTYKDKAEEIQQRMEIENMQLTESLATLRLQEETARRKVQEMEGEKAALEKKIASLQAEVEEGRRGREVEVKSLEQQLSDARKCYQIQLERSVTRATTLEGELVEAKGKNDRLEQEVSRLKEELEVATADRGSYKVNYHQAVNEVDRVRAELAKVQEEMTELHSVHSGLDRKACKDNTFKQSKRTHDNRNIMITKPPRSQLPQDPSMSGHDLDVSSTHSSQACSYASIYIHAYYTMSTIACPI